MNTLSFKPPGPGSWALDAAHCERPRSQYMLDLFATQACEGFRAGFARYGVLLDTIEFAAVGPFPYTCVRPLGARPGAQGLPPKWVFKLLLAVHPTLRRRLNRARQVMAEKSWREDVTGFWRELPSAEAQVAAFASEPIDTLDSAAFIDYLTRLGAAVSQRVFDHFHYAPAGVIPVGDFLAHAIEWTGATPQEALAALRGHSPASVAAGSAFEDAAAAIGNDSCARTTLSSAQPPAAILDALRRLEGPVGSTLGHLFNRYGDAILSGYDLTELRIAELPELIVSTLRARVASSTTTAAGTPDQNGLATLRARVPPPRRPLFDELLADARAAYPLRDGRVSVDMWALGVLRRALLEAGRRLARMDKLESSDDVFDATQQEILLLLRGSASPTASDIAGRAHIRRTSTLSDAPLTLGPPAGQPPPADWYPPYAARMERAFATYRSLLDEDTQSVRDEVVVRGVGASAGRSRGIARLVRSPADFGSLRQGDILVAPTTTPTYNAILPLLAGIVTDRGGLLSHPAIVSREYGFPGIVGARDATTRIPDGALIEIDGDAGTVKVLAG